MAATGGAKAARAAKPGDKKPDALGGAARSLGNRRLRDQVIGFDPEQVEARKRSQQRSKGGNYSVSKFRCLSIKLGDERAVGCRPGECRVVAADLEKRVEMRLERIRAHREYECEGVLIHLCGGISRRLVGSAWRGYLDSSGYSRHRSAWDTSRWDPDSGTWPYPSYAPAHRRSLQTRSLPHTEGHPQLRVSVLPPHPSASVV